MWFYGNVSVVVLCLSFFCIWASINSALSSTNQNQFQFPLFLKIKERDGFQYNRKKISRKKSVYGFLTTSSSYLSSPSTSFMTVSSSLFEKGIQNNNLGLDISQGPLRICTKRSQSFSSASSQFRQIKRRTRKEMSTKIYLKLPENINLDLNSMGDLHVFSSSSSKWINLDLIGSSLLSDTNLPTSTFSFQFPFPFPTIFPSLLNSVGENVSGIFSEVAGESLPGLIPPTLFFVGVPLIGLVSLGIMALNKSQKQGVEGALKKMEDQIREDIVLPESSESNQRQENTTINNNETNKKDTIFNEKKDIIVKENNNEKEMQDLDMKRTSLIKEYTENQLKERQKIQQKQNDFRQNQKAEFLKDLEMNKKKEEKLMKLQEERSTIVEKYSKIAAEYTRQKKEKEENLRKALFEEFLALEKNKEKSIALEQAQDKLDKELQKEATKKLLKEAIDNTKEKKENSTSAKKKTTSTRTTVPSSSSSTTTTTTTTRTIKSGNSKHQSTTSPSSIPKTKAPPVSPTSITSSPEEQAKRAKEIRDTIMKLNEAKAIREKKKGNSTAEREKQIKENRIRIEKAVANLKNSKSFDVGTKFIDNQETKISSPSKSEKNGKATVKKKSREELLQGLDDVMDALKKQVKTQNVNLEEKSQSKGTKGRKKTSSPSSPVSNKKVIKKGKDTSEQSKEKKTNTSSSRATSSKKSVSKQSKYSEASSIIVQQTIESLTIPKLKAFLLSNSGRTLPSKARKADYVQATFEYVEETLSFEEAMKKLEGL